MSSVIAMDVPLELDLSALSRYLYQSGLPHRIVESAGRQLVYVASEADARHVCDVYDGLQEGVLEASPVKTRSKSISSRPTFLQLMSKVPVTLVVIVLCFSVTAAMWFSEDSVIALFAFQEWVLSGREWVPLSLQETLASGQLWRLLSPIFLHFSILHLVFNTLWMWELGKRIEISLGGFSLLSIVIITGVCSNLGQYFYGGAGLFGGLSGVVYGLVGFIWLSQKLLPARGMHMPDSLFYALVGFMFIAMTGVLELLGMGSIANAAHVAGLVAGLVLALLEFIYSISFNKEARH
ncbi:MAG: rhomboid family intramembrane serine protease [Pseudomonadales bacterium]